MSRRAERVAHLLRNEIADAIRTRLNDPRIAPFTSLTRVELSPDLSFARVHVSVMADEPAQALTIKALTRASGRIREYLKDKIELRQIPGLVFELDVSLKKGAAMVEQLDRLRNEMDARGPVPPTTPAEEPALEDGNSTQVV